MGRAFSGLLPEHHIEITLAPDDNDNRVIVITGVENFTVDDYAGGVGGS